MWFTIFKTTSSHTFCTDAAMSNSRSAIHVSGFLGGPPKNSSKAPFVIVSPWSYEKYFMFSLNEPSSFKWIISFMIRSK